MRYAIAAGHDITADAAELILREGGNAFDAAIAAFMAAWVVEPCMASAGGGGFATALTAQGKSIVFDFFCQTPIYKRAVSSIDFYPVFVDFGDYQEPFHIGLGSIGVPGSVAGIFDIHQRLGSIPLKELIIPAVEAARNGVRINDFQHMDFVLLADILKISEHSRSIFYTKEGVLKKIGDTTYMPQLADFMEYMAADGRAAFYESEIAQKIVKDQQEKGGFLTMKDFENYQVHLRQPLSFNFLGNEILTNPLPSTGGATIALMLKELQQHSPIPHHLGKAYIELLRNVFEKIDGIPKSPEALYQALYGTKPLVNTANFSSKRGSTTHFSIADAVGNAISLTTSNGEGSGYFANNTDIQLNNMLGEAALLPNGFHSWLPDTRLSSMMSPTIVLNAKKQLLAILGSGGASRIPSAITQVLYKLLSGRLTLDEAVNTARIHVEHNTLNIESGFKDSLLQSSIPQKINQWRDYSLFFGGVHSIFKENQSYVAVGDHRRDGVVRVGSK